METAIPAGCTKRCGPNGHQYTPVHPFPHPVEMPAQSRADYEGSAAPEPRTEEMPRQDLIPVDVHRDRPEEVAPPAAVEVDLVYQRDGQARYESQQVAELRGPDVRVSISLPDDPDQAGIARSLGQQLAVIIPAALRGDVLAHLQSTWTRGRGLPTPPPSWSWAVSFGSHDLPGSHGAAHLVPREGTPLDARISAFCGEASTAWLMVGRWEAEGHVPCPRCADVGGAVVTYWQVKPDDVFTVLVKDIHGTAVHIPVEQVREMFANQNSGMWPSGCILAEGAFVRRPDAPDSEAMPIAGLEDIPTRVYDLDPRQPY